MQAKILIVDDSATDRSIIKNRLTEHTILTACEGEEALLLIDEHQDIDIVLLDLNMPKMDGFEVLSVLKSNDRYKKLRTIILTNSNEPENEIRGLKMGAVDYIRKPINMSSLQARIDVHLEFLKLQHKYEQELHSQALTFDTIFQQAPIGITISLSQEPINDNDAGYYNVNPKFEEIIGRTKEEIIKLGWANITHPYDLEEDTNNYKKLLSGEIDSYSMDKRYVKHDGSVLWVHIVVAKIELTDDYGFNHICFIQDISKRKEAEESLKESERSKSVLLSHIPGMAYRCNYDRDWTMLYVSDGCFNLTGYTPENLLYNNDLSYNDLITLEYREPIWNKWKRIIAEKQPFKYEYEIMTAQGERKWVLEMGQATYNEEGSIEALEGIILDISDRKEIENNLKFISEHDTLTGLYNRRYLENLLARDAQTETTDRRALISINLSPIQALSLTYGFHYTQEVVRKVAISLKKHCTEKCQLYNTYENRFVFYIKEYMSENELTVFCEDIIYTLESVLNVERIGGGIGVVEIDEHNRHNIEEILKNLLIASEKAISLYNTNFGLCFFNDEMEAQIIREEKIKLELAKIEAAESYNGVFLEFQPILDIKSNKITEFEALARIKSNDLGILMPAEFIPIAEETKLIVPLGKNVFIQAFEFLNKLKENGYDKISVSVNISVLQLIRDDFIKDLFQLMDEMQVNPANVILEITESIFASDYDEINWILGIVKDTGIKIAIDDFGTGYSSLSRERELNVNIIKIDKYFSDKLLVFKDKESIAGDIISMVHKMGHSVVAEGVEHEEQRQYFENKGCDKLQGYLISEPLEKKAAVEFLKNNEDITYT